MSEAAALQRRISLEEEKFNYSVDFVFYGFLISIASARPSNQKTELGNERWDLYLTESKYKKCRPLLRKWLGDVTPQTIRNKMKKFLESGMIRYDGEKKEYTFPYDENEKYFIVSRDIIFYLCATTTSLVIQTYVYLASRFEWKRNYEFTIKEIKVGLGYSEASQNATAEAVIKAALISLQQQGFIDVERRQSVVHTDKGDFKTSKLILKDVATTIMPERLINEIKRILPELTPRLTAGDIFSLEEK